MPRTPGLRRPAEAGKQMPAFYERMSTATAKKSNPAQESAFRCVPISAAEAAANLRLCAVLREQADPATGHLILLRQTLEARAILGAMCDANGDVHEWLELWIQDIDVMPAGETLVPSNSARDKAWEQLVARLRGADPEGSFSTSYEKDPARPTFIDTAKWRPWHPATEAKEIEVCRDDTALAAAGLPKYSESTARVGRPGSGGPFLSLNQAAQRPVGTVPVPPPRRPGA